MSAAIKTIWNTVTSILVILVAALAIALVGVRLLGFQVFTVLSGSMEPEYPTGSLIYVREVDHRTLKPGDVITFMLSEKTVATHRIVEVVTDAAEPDTLRFRTKGDANPNPDGGLVHYKNIIGSPRFVIPWLGYLAGYIRQPPGSYLAVSAGAILLILVFLPDLLFPTKKKKIHPPADQKQDLP